MLPESGPRRLALIHLKYSLAEAFAFKTPEGANFLASGLSHERSRRDDGFRRRGGSEIATGQTISQQFARALSASPHFSMIIAGFSSYTANMEAPAAGPFAGEGANGRAAMVGMGIMLAYETVRVLLSSELANF